VYDTRLVTNQDEISTTTVAVIKIVKDRGSVWCNPNIRLIWYDDVSEYQKIRGV
jgi:hypothetical protein